MMERQKMDTLGPVSEPDSNALILNKWVTNCFQPFNIFLTKETSQPIDTNFMENTQTNYILFFHQF